MRTLVVALLLVTPLTLLAPATAAPTKFDALVPGFDGHKVPVTVYVADAASAPTLLWGHGWAGSRADAASAGAFFSANGYNVVAMDFRGHGEARTTSAARVHDVDFEIKDTIAVIDWVASKPWAQLDAAGDPKLGALGGSYGGGYQLLTAAFDDRLDAIAPEITWNDLPYALAPNDAIKSGWVDLLYGAGVARANLDPMIHQAFAYGMTTNQLPDGSAPGIPDLIAQFTESSPRSYTIDTPAFIIQGTPDTLFNLNQAVWNARQIQATGAEVKLLTHLGGHIINTVGTIPGGLPDTGLQPAAAPSPCGAINAAILKWYDHQLKGAADTLPAIQVGFDDGTCRAYATLDDVASPIAVSAPGAIVPQGVTTPSMDGRLLGLPIRVAALGPAASAPADVALAGIPRVSTTATLLGNDGIVYFALAAVREDGSSRVLSSQVTPIRLRGAGEHAVDMELGGVASILRPGESLALQVSGFDGQYAQNAEREPGVVILDAITVTLPLAN